MNQALFHSHILFFFSSLSLSRNLLLLLKSLSSYHSVVRRSSQISPIQPIRQPSPRMSRPISQRKVACTFDDCSRLFLSVEEMRSHKESEPLHDYCDRCDMDFENEERFLIHKIMTASKHIVCPICGIDFRSEGGRDAHIRQVNQLCRTHNCPLPFSKH